MINPTRLLCIGSVLWDIIASASRKMSDGSDVPGLIRRRPGGVALNIAIELSKQGGAVELMSSVGRDADGDALLAALPGIGCDLVYRSSDPTDTYMALENPDGTVFGAIADCASLERAGTKIVEHLAQKAPLMDAVILDGNLPVPVLEHIFAQNLTRGTKTALVPASPGKAERLRNVFAATTCTLYVNKFEAELIANQKFESAAVAAQTLFSIGAASSVVTDGPRPAAQANNEGVFEYVPPQVKAKSTTGAGDVFLATHILAELAGAAPMKSLKLAAQAASKHIVKDVQ